MPAPAISSYISTGADRQKAEIVSIAVHPDQQNRGIATALMTDTPRLDSSGAASARSS